MNILNESKLELDSFYLDTEIDEMGLIQISNQKMDYEVYEKDSIVYFFEKVGENLYRLFCKTSRKSFYLS